MVCLIWSHLIPHRCQIGFQMEYHFIWNGAFHLIPICFEMVSKWENKCYFIWNELFHLNKIDVELVIYHISSEMVCHISSQLVSIWVPNGQINAMLFEMSLFIWFQLVSNWFPNGIIPFPNRIISFPNGIIPFPNGIIPFHVKWCVPFDPP